MTGGRLSESEIQFIFHRHQQYAETPDGATDRKWHPLQSIKKSPGR